MGQIFVLGLYLSQVYSEFSNRKQGKQIMRHILVTSRAGVSRSYRCGHKDNAIYTFPHFGK